MRGVVPVPVRKFLVAGLSLDKFLLKSIINQVHLPGEPLGHVLLSPVALCKSNVHLKRLNLHSWVKALISEKGCHVCNR